MKGRAGATLLLRKSRDPLCMVTRSWYGFGGSPPAYVLGDLRLIVSYAGSSLFPPPTAATLPGSYNGGTTVRTQRGPPSESGDIFRLVETVSGVLFEGAGSLLSF